MLTDLFYSETNFLLTNSVYFPKTDVIGLIICTLEDAKLPLKVTKLKTLKTIKSTIILFTIADTDNNVELFIECPLSSEVLDDYTFNIYDSLHNYCGCLSVNYNFMAWLHTIQGISCNVLDNSLFINPSFCYNNHMVKDNRLHYNNVPLDTLELEGVFIQAIGDSTTYEIISKNPDSTAQQNIQTGYLQKLVLRNNQSSASLTGESICILMACPGTGEYCNTTISFDGEQLLIEDASMKGLL